MKRTGIIAAMAWAALTVGCGPQANSDETGAEIPSTESEEAGSALREVEHVRNRDGEDIRIEHNDDGTVSAFGERGGAVTGSRETINHDFNIDPNARSSRDGYGEGTGNGGGNAGGRGSRSDEIGPDK